MTKYKISDVTNDLKFLMSLTNIFGVDDQGFWFDILKNERFKYKLDSNDTPKEIVIFQDPFPKGDFYYFNPLAEGLGGKSPADQLFQRTIRANFNSNFRIAIRKLVDSLLQSKENDGPNLSHVELRMSSVPVDKKTSLIDYVDDKLVDELKKIFDRTNENFFSVAYIQTQQTAKVMCDVFSDPQWAEKYSTDIRKKSILALKSLILGILGIEKESDIELFNVKYDPDLKSAARLDTTLRAYLKLYSKFNDILPEEVAIDLGGLNDVIDRLPMAYSIAKHMVQPSLPRHSPTDLSPSDTSKVNTITASSGKRMPSPFSRDQRNDHFSGSRFNHGGPIVNQMGHGRFRAQVIDSGPIDPTSPVMATQSNMSGRPITGGGFGYSNRGYFGGGSTFSPSSSGPDFTPGSMFGRPEMNRRYFG